MRDGSNPAYHLDLVAPGRTSRLAAQPKLGLRSDWGAWPRRGDSHRIASAGLYTARVLTRAEPTFRVRRSVALRGRAPRCLSLPFGCFTLAGSTEKMKPMPILLVIDDDETVVHVFGRIFEDTNVKVITA